jgi:hypothetical protein
MKTKTFIKTFFFSFFLIFLNSLCAQETNTIFKIKFSIDNNRVVMENVEGNNWNSLAVKSKSFHLYQNGMIEPKFETEEYQNSNYVFSVDRKGNKITLVGKKGTNWKQLEFIVPNNETIVLIDQNGIKS